jgi:5-oxoprolinase (ATP-hydrolysing) subunit C
MTLTITRVTGFATVQDLGRPGRMHEALAPGGALVLELLVAANRAARNPDDAPAIEVLGQLVVRADAELVVGTNAGHSMVARGGARGDRDVDGDHDAARMLRGDADTLDGSNREIVGGTHVLRAGDTLTIASEPRRVAYLALRGGVDAPLVLGGRGTQLSAGLGAALRSGDRLAPAGVSEVDQPIAGFVDHGAIRVIPGPDAAAFASDALDILVGAPYRILPTSDRVGTRLGGASILRATTTDSSRPMVRGAIEVPRDGQPIVLGPEHPTTGGYPVVAVIAHADLGRFFATRLGGFVRFTR